MATDPTFTTSPDHRRLEASVTFNADSPLTLSASNASGHVDITTDATLPAGTIEVAAIRTDNGEFADDDHHLTVKVEGNTISIHPDWQFASGVSGLARRIRDQLQYGFRPEDWNLSRLRLSPELDFHIIVRLPANLADGSQIKLRTASGEVDARNFRAGTSIITASGDVNARDLTGTISIHTASGDVDAENIIESLEINTASGDVSISGGDAWLAARSASGDVEIHDFVLRNARITTVSGDVSLRATFNNAANYGIETVSGDVSLKATLPNAAARLGFGTLSGSSHVGGVWEKQKRREWTAGSGASGATINIKTVSGDLTASADLDESVEARTLAMPQRTPDVTAETHDGDDLSDFKDEMKAFGQEMKEFGREIRHMVGAGEVPRVPPTPPTPPTPPHGGDPGHLHDREQRRAEKERAREAKQQAREERRKQRDDASPIFTAGPAGVDYQHDTAPLTPDTDASPAEETAPVEPARPFTEAPGMDQPEPATTPEDAAQEQDADTSQATENTSTDARLRVLEALEKGEIDIEDALSQLDRDSENA